MSEINWEEVAAQVTQGITMVADTTIGFTRKSESYDTQKRGEISWVTVGIVNYGEKCTITFNALDDYTPRKEDKVHLSTGDWKITLVKPLAVGNLIPAYEVEISK